MNIDLWAFILDTLEGAGVIGGYVAISIIGVHLITYASRGKLSGNNQIGPRGAHPIIGALLGIIPGCGATIIVSSMYKNQKISFGGLFAAFIATLGEGSFVLLGASDEASVTANLKAFVIVNLVSAITAIIFGYLVDIIGITIDAPEGLKKLSQQNAQSIKGKHLSRAFVDHIGFYIMLMFSVLLLPGSIIALWGGELTDYDDVSVWAAILFSIFSIIYYIMYKYTYKRLGCLPNINLRRTLLHAVFDISTVIVYIFAGLLIANYTIDILVGPETFDAWMTSSPFFIVAIAAIIGAAPGCGGMISVAVTFLAIPNFPIAALIAAGIATSGDGIFPLLASNRKTALVITSFSFIIALIVGYVILALSIEFQTILQTVTQYFIL